MGGKAEERDEKRRVCCPITAHKPRKEKMRITMKNKTLRSEILKSLIKGLGTSAGYAMIQKSQANRKS